MYSSAGRLASITTCGRGKLSHVECHFPDEISPFLIDSIAAHGVFSSDLDKSTTMIRGAFPPLAMIHCDLGRANDRSKPQGERQLARSARKHQEDPAGERSKEEGRRSLHRVHDVLLRALNDKGLQRRWAGRPPSSMCRAGRLLLDLGMVLQRGRG